jgi:hypothetical protein
MIDAAYLEPDEGGWSLILDDSFGTHAFRVDPEILDDALKSWREHVAEGEAVRAEYEASGRQPWDEYKAAQERMDPEYADEIAERLRVQADLLRKIEREGGPR